MVPHDSKSDLPLVTDRRPSFSCPDDWTCNETLLLPSFAKECAVRRPRQLKRTYLQKLSFYPVLIGLPHRIKQDTIYVPVRNKYISTYDISELSVVARDSITYLYLCSISGFPYIGRPTHCTRWVKIGAKARIIISFKI